MLRSVRRYALHLAVTFALAGAISTSAVAQNATVDQFVANPSQVLTQFPTGGALLISLVRDTAVSHPEALQSLIDAMKAANNPDIESAFGSGLGQAAQLVFKTDEPYANRIRAAVAASGSDRANLALNGVTPDLQIAAGGGGAGGPGGGSGGSAGGTGSGTPSGGANTGTGQVFGSTFIQTSQQTFTGGGAGVGSGTVSNRVSGR